MPLILAASNKDLPACFESSKVDSEGVILLH